MKGSVKILLVDVFIYILMIRQMKHKVHLHMLDLVHLLFDELYVAFISVCVCAFCEKFIGKSPNLHRIDPIAKKNRRIKSTSKLKELVRNGI